MLFFVARGKFVASIFIILLLINREVQKTIFNLSVPRIVFVPNLQLEIYCIVKCADLAILDYVQLRISMLVYANFAKIFEFLP
jgi:hypothetical protein